MTTHADTLSAPCPPADTPQTVHELRRGKVLILGDIMLDEYLMGTVERISPEAPVPVVQIYERRHVLGGAGNVARNICALGGKASLLGITGSGTNGKALASLVDASGIDGHILHSSQRRTCVKSRVMAQQQQMIRLDHEDSTPLSVADQDALLQLVHTHIANYAVLVLSDYAKGLVCPRFMKKLRHMLREQAPHIRLLIDPKPENTPLYQGAWLLTPNTKEMGQSARMPTATTEQIRLAGRTLMEYTGCTHLVATLGAQGMAVFMHPTITWRMPTVARSVFDVTGAGDTVMATLALSLSVNHDLLLAAMLANAAAGVSVAKLGAATVTPEELTAALLQRGLPHPEPWE
ncbi:MAG: PfkB family carbohydrate kinase [Desulfovibrionaceae bacterium]